MSKPKFINVNGPDSQKESVEDTEKTLITAKMRDEDMMTRPLPFIAGDSDEPAVEIAQSCEIGNSRQRNEDSTFSFMTLFGGQTAQAPIAVSIVADGMGGHADGHEASRIVSSYVGQYIMSRIVLPVINEEQVEDPIQDILKQAVVDASRIIHTSSKRVEGGTTLTAALMLKSRLYLAHIGDTRAYLITRDKIEKLTTDHSIVQKLIDTGQITEEEAEFHPHRNLLYRAVTGDVIEIDFITRPLPKTGALLLCSDGLWGSVSDETIHAVILDNRLELPQKCNQLVKLALSGGSKDNITGIITQFRL
ncbi:MAG: protein phosphatase 2C domain-containing protein [Chloroflexota bacterium]